MAELNFGLLTPPGSQNIGNAFVQGMDQAAVARAQANQNALAQYTLGKAKREDELTTKVLAGMQGATTLEQQAAVLRSVGKFREANELIAAGLDRQIKLGTLNAQPGAAARVAAQTARDRQQWEGQALRDLGNNPSDDHIRALGQDAVRKEIYTQDQADQKVAEFLAVPLADRAAKFKQYGAPAAAPQQPLEITRLIAYRDSLPLGRDRDAVTDIIEKSSNENIILNPVTGLPEDRRQRQQPLGAFVDPGIPQGVTPQMQMSNADEARLQARAMNAAGMPVNIRGGGNALPGAQPQPQPAAVNMPGAQPAAATTTPSNPRQTQPRFETSEKIRGSESEALGKLGVDEYKQLGTAATNARKAMPGIDTAERILNAGFNTGWGTEAQAAAANILASLGVLDAKNYATNAQLFLAQARTVTNDRLLDQKGPQTDNDFKRTEETGARLGNTADANKFLLAVNRAINKQTIEKHNFFTKWVSKNDSLKGAEQAWQDSPAGSASLFDRPELKQYAQVKPAAATSTTTAKPAAPAVGEIRDGYRFNGGDPAKIGNWEKVTP